jgi:autotransporter-associated beta strand protein
MKTTTLLLRRALFLCAFLFGIFGVSWGQTISDWLSNAPDGNWRQGASGQRWSTGEWNEPNYGIIRFNNNHQLSMTNNVSGPYNQFKIIFGSSNSSARTISGTSSNSVRFADFSGAWPRIDNESSATHTINFPIIVNSGGTWNLELATNNSSTGKLIFGSNATISNNTSKILYIYGNSTTNSGRYVELNGVISGNGNFQVKLGGIAKIGANHTYTGSTTIEHGELWIDNSGDLSASSSINLGLSTSMSSVAKIFVSDLDGGTTFTRNIIVSDGNTSTRYIGSFNTSGINYFSGTISRSAANNLTLEAFSSNGSVEFSNIINGSGEVIKIGLGTVVLTAENSYSGQTTINEGTLQLNKTGGSTLPSGNSITVNNGGTLRISSNQTLVGLTIALGGSVLVDANVQLTVSGTLTNNGTFTLQNDATFVQATTGNGITGNGTFNVEKALAGNSSTWNATSGRFWYMGVPMVNVARSSFGSYAAGTNRVWSYDESTTLYTDITDNTATLSAGTGYVHRRSADGTLTFSANGLDGLYRTDVSLPSLTRTAGASAGYHLISNPYMAYLDWDAVIAANGTANIESTYYIRSAEPTNNDALISYNSNGPNYASGGVASIDQVEDVRYIAPMQSIWVRVGTASATGSLAMTRSMLSHQSNNPGLKNTSIFPTSARVNLVDGARFDQMLIFMNQDMSNGVDQYDSEKMFVSGAPQLYTMAAGKKLVMNGLKNNKKKISVPLYLELPESKVYNLQLAEYFLEDGLILLEDKQEGTIQDFSINAIYPFYANSGLLQNRFVLHFIAPDNGIGAQGPNNNWVAEETSYGEGGNILISSDSKGKVQITLDQPLTENITGMVQATDINGKIVFSAQLTGALTEFQMNVPSGIYYLSVQNGSIIQNKKVFVQN